MAPEVAVTVPPNVTDVGLVVLPIVSAPADVISPSANAPGAPDEFNVISPVAVVEITPDVWLMALAVIVRLFEAPVIVPPSTVRVPVTVMVFPAPTSRVPLVAFIVAAERSLVVSVQYPVPAGLFIVTVEKLESPVLIVFPAASPSKVTVPLPCVNMPELAQVPAQDMALAAPALKVWLASMVMVSASMASCRVRVVLPVLAEIWILPISIPAEVRS